MASKVNKTNAANKKQANGGEATQNPPTEETLSTSAETSAASINAGAVTQNLELTDASGSDVAGAATETAPATTAGENPAKPKAPEASKVTKKDAPDNSVKVIEKRKIQVLHVVAKREKFRRAGFLFGSERTRLVVDDLTAEQIRQLKEEPLLVVTGATEEI
ncbi:MAG: hypothetical protein JNL77_05525 [Nitrosomonas sp.]|nr:hypothetical protein [Nitrosomonas sp.]